MPQLVVRTTTPGYAGFRVSIGAIGIPHHKEGHEVLGSYKANFSVAAGSEFAPVTVPFNQFSWDWSDYTGSCATKDPDGYQHKCCSDSPDVCWSCLDTSCVVG